MKKLYFKKSLALLMTVMMLLSCWVFVAPTEAEAATEVSYTVTLKWNFDASSPSGHIIIRYYKFYDDGTGIDLNSKGEYELSSLSGLGGNQEKTFTVGGFPYEIYIKNGSSGSKGGSFGLKWIKIGTKQIVSENNYGIGKGDDHTFSLAGASAGNSSIWGDWVNDAKKNWTNPVPTSWSTSLASSKTLSIPASGSVGENFSAAAKDQYGVKWYKAPKYSLSSSTGVSITDAGYFNATIAALSSDNSYNSSTGKATVKLTASYANYNTSWNLKSESTITLVSPTYKVSFLDGNGASFGTAQTCYYGGSVSYPTGTPTQKEDNTYHYTFKGWPEGQNTNITANKSIFATFNSIAHEFSGAVRYKGDGKHEQKCKDCSIYGWGKTTGATQDCIHKNNAWTQSADGSVHYNVCDVTGCGYTIQHNAKWVNVVATKYAVPGSEQSCTVDGLYYQSCETCGAINKNVTFVGKPMTGHNFTSGGAIAGQLVPHTCFDNGYVPYSCGNGCGAVKNEIYLRDDSYAYDNSQIVDEDGIRYVVDANGQKVLVDAARHAFSTNLSAKDDNEHGYYCAACGSWDKLTGHNWTLTSTITAPTCVDDGLGLYSCTCGIAPKEGVIPADGESHNYLDPVSDGNGKHVATCSYCHDDIIEDCFDKNDDCVCDVCGYNIPHVYDKEVANNDTKASNADCYNAATYYYSCKCGEINKAEDAPVFSKGNPLTHRWTNTKNYKVSDPDCDTGTIYYKECSRCHASSENFDGATWEDTDKLGHNFTGAVKDNGNGTHSFACLNGCGEHGATAPCTFGAYADGKDGYHYRYCSECNHEEKQEHKMTAWAPVDPKAAEKSSQTRHCEFCEYTETTECTYNETVSPATCIKKETTTYECPECGHGFTVITGPEVPHQYNGEYKTDATGHKHTQRCTVENGCNAFNPEWTGCTLKYNQMEGDKHGVECTVCKYDFGTVDCYGGTAYCNALATCKDCKDTYGTLAPHAFSGEAQNVEPGKHNYKCLGCDKYGVGTTEGATEACKGGTAYCNEQAICEICNTYYGSFDPDSHKTTTAYPGLAPTCMQAGYTAYRVCDNEACGAVLDKEVIPVDPNAHAFDTSKAYEHEDNAEDYGTEPGKHYYKCLNEDVNGNKCAVVDVKDCVVGSTEVVDPTCLEVGYTRNFCAECGYEWRTDYTKETGHDWGDWIHNEDTLTHTRTCKNDASHKETTNCADSATFVVTDPTCTERGYTTYTCTLCDNVWVGEDTYVDALGHDYTEKIIDEAHKHDKVATCTNAQFYWLDCSRCDKNAKDETDFTKYPADTLYYENGTGEGHTWSDPKKTAYAEWAKLATPATCDKNATYYTYCTVCHLSSQGVEGVEATFERWGSLLSHDYQDLVIAENKVSDATCTAKAVYYKSCKNCGEVNEDETFTTGDFLAHVYTKEVKNSAHKITDATCSTKATYWYNCEHCNSNAKLIDKTGMTDAEIAALKYETGDYDEDNHTDIERFPVKNPTCLEAGHSAYEYCSACDTTMGKVTTGYEKKDHIFKGAYEKANDVDADGNAVYMHKRACIYDCGTYSAVSECTLSRAVQNADGKTHTQSCVCGNTITADCEAKANATCTVAATCKVCNGEIAGTNVGHSYPDTWTSSNDGKTHFRVCANDPSHIEKVACSGGDATGCGAVYCSICGQNYGTGTNHTWGEWVDVTAAGCETKAVHKRTCSACGATEEESYGSALGHDYDANNDGKADGVVTKDPTCTESGIMTFTCVNNCGKSYIEAIEPLKHKLPDTWTTVKEATCKEEGVEEKCCVNTWKDADGNTVTCDYKVVNYLSKDASKHVPGEWQEDATSANCSTGLWSYQYCTVCGVKVDQKYIKIDHMWVEEAIIWGSCTENGYIEMRCTVCNATARFDDSHPTFPNKFESTEIIPAIAEKLKAKEGHTWRTEALDGDKNYTTDKDGTIIYIEKAASCSQTGRGYKICENCPERSETITLKKLDHKLVTVEGKAPTCTIAGYKSYQKCNSCPYSETAEKIPALGHADNNKNGSCDRCGFEMYEKEDGSTSACGCLCHAKDGFSKFFYKIALFFWKIFKMNPSCECGNKHY